MKSENEQVVFDQSPKPRRARSREVTSRYLSPSSTASSHESGIPSPNSQSLSPIGHKPMTTTSTSSASSNTRKQHKSLDDSGFTRGLWPSSTTTTSSSSSSKPNKNSSTLGDHLGNERLKDRKKDKKSGKDVINGIFLNRQRSSGEFSRFENQKEISTHAKENNRPRIGGSMRYTEKLTLPGKSSSKTTSGILPGRFSVDENDLYRKISEPESDSFTDTFDLDSESGKMGSPPTGKISASSRKSGIEVSSKYMSEISARRASDSYVPVSFDNSPSSKKFNIKNAIKRVNSLSSAKSQWALSPGRSGSTPMSVENKGILTSFSSLKPPNSPSRAKGVEKLLNMGWDLLKGKKSSSSSLSSLPLLSGNLESVHQLRLLHNRLMQWRYANARAVPVNGTITNQAERDLVYAWDCLTKLRRSVMHKKLQVEKEKLHMKLNYILYSQSKLLEAWGNMERQHVSAVSNTDECLHAVVCKVPLADGAKVDIQLATIKLGHALDLTTSIKSIFTSFAPTAENTVTLLSELAEVVAQEKLLLEECLELCRTISTLELQERSMKCSIVQLKL